MEKKVAAFAEKKRKICSHGDAQPPLSNAFSFLLTRLFKKIRNLLSLSHAFTSRCWNRCAAVSFNNLWPAILKKANYIS